MKEIDYYFRQQGIQQYFWAVEGRPLPRTPDQPCRLPSVTEHGLNSSRRVQSNRGQT